MSNSFKTFLKHTNKDFKYRSVNPPLIRTSTMVFKSMNDLRQLQKKILKTLEEAILNMEDKAHPQHMN